MNIKLTIKCLLNYKLNAHSYLELGYYLKKHKHNLLIKHRFIKIGEKYGLDIQNFENIGENLVLGHPFGITVNPNVVIGNNCVLAKGCTIGSVRSGKRIGCPKIGNNVYIGVNAFVCGGITIGDDVLIASGSFVDFDVPSNSLVIGNPGVIKHKEKASKDYCVPKSKEDKNGR